LLKVVVGAFRYTHLLWNTFGAPKPLEFTRLRFRSRRTVMAKKASKKKKGKKKSGKKKR
jgi:hypothetical protein